MERNGKEYTEIPIKELVVNGKKIEGSMIPAEMTQNMDRVQVTIYTDRIKKENT